MALVMSLSALAQTPAHKVIISWTPSTSTCVTTVNIHRSLAPNSQIPVGTAGSNFASVPVGTSSFTDSTVIAGGTYYWTVSGFGGSCGGTLHESVMSAEIKTLVPTDAPAPPTGLTGVVQ